MVRHPSRYRGINQPRPIVKRVERVSVPVLNAEVIQRNIERGARLALGFGSIGETQTFRKPGMYLSSLSVRNEIDNKFVSPLLAFLGEKSDRVSRADYEKTRDTLRAQIANQRIDEQAAKNNGEIRPSQTKQEIAFALGRFCLDVAAATELNYPDGVAPQGWGLARLLTSFDQQLRPTIFASAVYAAPQLLPRPEPPK